MQLKEFAQHCIEKAEKAYEDKNKEEAIRLLTLLKEEIEKSIKLCRK